MIEGKSGLLAIHMEGERPHYEPSKRLITWPNGAIAQVFSADEPESLRGPQFDAAWCDELAKWRLGEAVWDMLAVGMGGYIGGRSLEKVAGAVVQPPGARPRSAVEPKAAGLIHVGFSLPGLEGRAKGLRFDAEDVEHRGPRACRLRWRRCRRLRRTGAARAAMKSRAGCRLLPP